MDLVDNYLNASATKENSQGSFGGQYHVCVVCHKEFSRESHLRLHEKSHGPSFTQFSVHGNENLNLMEENPGTCRTKFQCHVCDFGTVHRGQLTAHLRVHHTKEKHFPREFQNLGPSESVHQNLFQNQNQNQYGYQYQYQYQYPLQEQQPPYSQLLEVNCQFSDIDSMAVSAWDDLIKFPSPRTPSAPDLNSNSNFNFNLNSNSNSNSNSSLSDEVKRFSCPDCSYKTNQKQVLSRHMKTHDDSRPFGCSLCPYRAKRRDHVKQHVRNIHSSERPFKCQLCQFSAKVHDKLMKHMKTHSLDEQMTEV